MIVRAKFHVSSLENPEGAAAATVKLGAVCRGVENAIWAQATPAGSITMQVLNTPAFEQFEQGAEYLVTFEKVAKPTPGDGHTIEPYITKYGHSVCETCGLTVDPGPNGGAGTMSVEDLRARHAEVYAKR